MAKGTGRGGCLESILACLLVIFNSLLLMIGVGITVVGALAYWLPQLILSGIETYDFVTDLIPGDQDGLEADRIAGYLVPFGLAVFIVGVCVSIVAFIGCCGVCCRIRCFIIIYAVVIALVALFCIGVIIAFYGFRDEISDTLKDSMTELTHNEYRGDDDQGTVDSAVSLMITAMNREFQCCGVTNYQDYDGATQWNRTGHYQDSEGESHLIKNLVTPISCCIHEGDFPNDIPESPPECALEPNNQTSNYEKGCWDAITEEFDEPTEKVIIGVCVFLGVLALLFAFSIYLCQSKSFGVV